MKKIVTLCLLFILLIINSGCNKKRELVCSKRDDSKTSTNYITLSYENKKLINIQYKTVYDNVDDAKTMCEFFNEIYGEISTVIQYKCNSNSIEYSGTLDDLKITLLGDSKTDIKSAKEYLENNGNVCK